MKIVIVEDHLMFREVVRRVCVLEKGYEVVGESGTGAAGIELTLRLQPDLVILDVGLPDMDGFNVAQRVRAARSKARILILSCRLDDYAVVSADRAAVDGFLDKTTEAVSAIRLALEAVEVGGTYFSAEFQRFRRARKLDPYAFEKILTNAEQSVLRLIGEGLDDREIGECMRISPSTAQTHRSRILKKLSVDCTPKLMAFARKAGFVGSVSRSLCT